MSACLDAVWILQYRKLLSVKNPCWHILSPWRALVLFFPAIRYYKKTDRTLYVEWRLNHYQHQLTDLHCFIHIFIYFTKWSLPLMELIRESHRHFLYAISWKYPYIVLFLFSSCWVCWVCQISCGPDRQRSRIHRQRSRWERERDRETERDWTAETIECVRNSYPCIAWRIKSSVTNLLINLSSFKKIKKKTAMIHSLNDFISLLFTE